MYDVFSTSEGVRFYQVCFTEWSAPLMVVATDLKTAIETATEHRAGKGHIRPIIAWDATSEWQALSPEMRAHGEQALRDRRPRVVRYVEGHGWADVAQP